MGHMGGLDPQQQQQGGGASLMGGMGQMGDMGNYGGMGDMGDDKPLTSQFRGVCWNKKNRR